MDPNDTPNTGPLNDDLTDDWNVPMASDDTVDLDDQAANGDVVSDNDGAPQESDDPMEKDGEEMPQP